MTKRTYVTKKRMQEFLANNTYIKAWEDCTGEKHEAYYSKTDDSYITFVGLEDDLKHFVRMGITERLQAPGEGYSTTAIGFNPKENKWYGWSHRAIYGFGIGSTCEEGDCHYRPFDKEDRIKDAIRFWESDSHLDTHAAHEDKVDGRDGIWIEWTYNDKVPNKKIRGTTSSMFCAYPETYGKGTWTAKTIEDAKQMAIDFAKGVG